MIFLLRDFVRTPSGPAEHWKILLHIFRVSAGCFNKHPLASMWNDYGNKVTHERKIKDTKQPTLPSGGLPQRSELRQSHGGVFGGGERNSDKSDCAADDGVMKDCVFFSSTTGAVRARRDWIKPCPSFNKHIITIAFPWQRFRDWCDAIGLRRGTLSFFFFFFFF